MSTELENRNVKRLSNKQANLLTRECLQMSLVKLMAQKPFEKISISEIAKNAGVSRTAFYRNYNSKEEIIEDACEDVFNRIQRSFEEYKGDWKNWYYVIFKTVKDNSEMVKAALDAKIDIFPSGVLNASFPPKTKEEYYENIAREVSFYSIVLEWFNNGMEESPEVMANLCNSVYEV